MYEIYDYHVDLIAYIKYLNTIKDNNKTMIYIWNTIHVVKNKEKVVVFLLCCFLKSQKQQHFFNKCLLTKEQLLAHLECRFSKVQ
jgi:hypothetical protein